MLGRLVVATGTSSLLLVAASAPVLGAGRPSVGDAFPGRNGEIVFALGGREYPDLYLMRPDGTKLRRITRIRGTEMFPTWSPDGTRIAFISDRTRPRHEAAFEIYVMRPNGRGLRRVTRNRFVDYEPAWAPDGIRIIFQSSSPSGSTLSVINVNGTGFRRLTRPRDSAEDAAWSPDGKAIAFVRFNPTYTSQAIWLMNPDGSNQRQLTIPPQDPANERFGGDSMPDWSPDGNEIAFTRAYRGRTDIYAIRLDGTRLRRLTKGPGQHLWSAWSPNGRRIVFVTALYQRKAIDVINSDGTQLKRLSIGRGDYVHPDWQPLR